MKKRVTNSRKKMKEKGDEMIMFPIVYRPNKF